MQETTSKLNAHLVNQKITGIRFFNVNDSYFIFDKDSTWVFDTGVQLSLENGIFSFGWNSEFEAFDYSLEKPIEELQTNDQLYAVDPEETKPLEELVGTTIKDIAFDWDYFQEYDEYAQLKEEKIYIPVGMKLTFDNDQTLQLAAVRYSINPESGQLQAPFYSLEGALLVSFNRELEITQQN